MRQKAELHATWWASLSQARGQLLLQPTLLISCWGLPEAHLCWHKPYRMRLINLPTLTCCSQVMSSDRAQLAPYLQHKARYKVTPSVQLQGAASVPQGQAALFSCISEHHGATPECCSVWMLHLTHIQPQRGVGRNGAVSQSKRSSCTFPVCTFSVLWNVAFKCMPAKKSSIWGL